MRLSSGFFSPLWMCIFGCWTTVNLDALSLARVLEKVSFSHQYRTSHITLAPISKNLKRYPALLWGWGFYSANINHEALSTTDQKRSCVCLSVWLYESEMWLLEGRQRCLEDERSVGKFTPCMSITAALSRDQTQIYIYIYKMITQHWTALLFPFVCH